MALNFPAQSEGLYDICCIGHITLDKVVTPRSEVYMAGGTSIYFSYALRNMDINYLLVTALGKKERHFVQALRDNGIQVHAAECDHTVYFENIYPEDSDERTQRVLQKAAPFSVGQLAGVNARVYHLGPLLADDISVDIIRHLAGKGIVSLDVQGYLRTVLNKQVHAIEWKDKLAALPYIHILKASKSEMESLTGQKDVRLGARMISDWGVEQVIITMGSQGSLIYADGIYYSIPAFKPATSVVDATGCGDTYMAGYLYECLQGASPEEAGYFAAAMATLKIEGSGPFTGGREDVDGMLAGSRPKAFYAEA